MDSEKESDGSLSGMDSSGSDVEIEEERRLEKLGTKC